MTVVTSVLFISVITFSVQMGQWKVAYPNDSKVDLNAWTGGEISSCESVSIKESVLLMNIPMFPVRGYLHMTLVSESSVLFGPDVPQGLCAENPSLMMTQTFANDRPDCNPSFPFCEVPHTCKYGGNKEKKKSHFHNFFCKCMIESCGKFMLMLRPESASERIYGLRNLRYVMSTSNLKESNMLMDFQYKVIV